MAIAIGISQIPTNEVKFSYLPDGLETGGNRKENVAGTTSTIWRTEASASSPNRCTIDGALAVSMPVVGLLREA